MGVMVCWHFVAVVSLRRLPPSGGNNDCERGVSVLQCHSVCWRSGIRRGIHGGDADFGWISWHRMYHHVTPPPSSLFYSWSETEQQPRNHLRFHLPPITRYFHHRWVTWAFWSVCNILISPPPTAQKAPHIQFRLINLAAGNARLSYLPFCFCCFFVGLFVCFFKLTW